MRQTPPPRTRRFRPLRNGSIDEKVDRCRTEDKIKNKTQQLKGKAKEVAGRSVGNESLERKGRLDQAKGDLKQAGEEVKDAVHE